MHLVIVTKAEMKLKQYNLLLNLVRFLHLMIGEFFFCWNYHKKTFEGQIWIPDNVIKTKMISIKDRRKGTSQDPNTGLFTLSGYTTGSFCTNFNVYFIDSGRVLYHTV